MFILYESVMCLWTACACSWVYAYLTSSNWYCCWQIITGIQYYLRVNCCCVIQVIKLCIICTNLLHHHLPSLACSLESTGYLDCTWCMNTFIFSGSHVLRTLPLMSTGSFNMPLNSITKCLYTWCYNSPVSMVSRCVFKCI